jgi:hypothetical protein
MNIQINYTSLNTANVKYEAEKLLEHLFERDSMSNSSFPRMDANLPHESNFVLQGSRIFTHQ